MYCPTTGRAIRSPGLPSRHRVGAAPPPTRRSAFRRGAATPRHLMGKTIGGKYRVRSILGEGGMGTVFEAEHIALGRSVAVKVLHATHATKKDSIRRFQQEARAAGAIGHPNICGVIDLGTLDDGSPYIVMERLVRRDAGRARSPRRPACRSTTSSTSSCRCSRGSWRRTSSGSSTATSSRRTSFSRRRVGCPPLVKVLDFGVSKMTGPLGRVGAARGPRAHPHRHGDGNALLHGARAGPRRARPRRPRRSLCLRRDSLRGAHRQAPVHGAELQRAAGADPHRDASSGERAPPRAARWRSTRSSRRPWPAGARIATPRLRTFSATFWRCAPQSLPRIVAASASEVMRAAAAQPPLQFPVEAPSSVGIPDLVRRATPASTMPSTPRT